MQRLAAIALILALGITAVAHAGPPSTLPDLGTVHCQTVPAQDGATLLGLVNGYRAASGLPALSDDPALDAAAQQGAQAIADGGMRQHGDYAGRAHRCGYPTDHFVGEDLAVDGNALSAFADWQGSAPHAWNLLCPCYTAVGVGAAQLADGSVAFILDFGGTVLPSTTMPPD